MTLRNSSEKNGLVIADSGAIFSLAVIDQLEILNALFDDISIPNAVWNEITLDKTTDYYSRIWAHLRVRGELFSVPGVETPGLFSAVPPGRCFLAP